MTTIAIHPITSPMSPINPKPYLGGYKNKQTHSIYHNATTQTEGRPLKGWKDISKIRSRDTQTYTMVTKSSQSSHSVGTDIQGTRSDENTCQKVLLSKSYITSEVLQNKKLESILHIQAFWRMYLAKHKVDKMFLCERDENIVSVKRIANVSKNFKISDHSYFVL